MIHETSEPIDTLQELLASEESTLIQLRTRQKQNRESSLGESEQLDPDIEMCEEMIRIWTERIHREQWTSTPVEEANSFGGAD